MQKVKIEVNSQSLMSRVSRMFEQTEESMLLEVFQNARRSGATEIYLSKEGNVLTVANNGKAINDFQKLLTLGESGDVNEDEIYLQLTRDEYLQVV